MKYTYFISYYIWFPTGWTFGWSETVGNFKITTKEDLLKMTKSLEEGSGEGAKVTILNFILLRTESE